MKKTDRLDIDRIAFIGRTYFEYLRMFNLDGSDLAAGPVLDCGSGPSSFVAEAHQSGFKVVGCDPLYDVPPAMLLEKGRGDIEHVFDKLDEVRHLYTWNYYRDKDEIIGFRQRALSVFSRDFSGGLRENRYVQAALPNLPFPDRAFRLVLSSHLLFLYGDRLDPDFHKASLREMARISSGEVRVFPLQGLDAKPYPYMDEVLAFLEAQRIGAEIVEVPFEFQRGSNRMLKLKMQSDRGKTMMATDRVHVLLDVTIKDKDKFLQYVEGHKASLQQYGGRLLFRSNDLEAIEGDWLPKLFVVQEWPSEEAFREWHGSNEYAPWKTLRHDAMDVNMVLARKMRN